MRITANQVTFARLLLMPPLAAMLYGGRTATIAAVFIGTFVGLTDLVDGYLARKHGPTVLGGLMDPIADKVFIAVGFVPMVDLGLTPWWAAALLFLREFVVTALRSSYEDRQLSLKTTYLAKVKTWVQMIGIGLLFLQAAQTPKIVTTILLGGGAAGALVGGLLARFAFKRAWRGSWVFAACFAAATAVWLFAPLRAFTIFSMAAIVGITWASGIDYLVVGVRELGKARDFHLFDGVRLIGAIAFPLLAMFVLVRTEAPVWAILAVVSVELAHGGLDNLLAHHRSAQGPAAWGARVLGVCALLAAALVVPQAAAVLAVVAVALSATLTAIAFYRNRRFYLEEKLREKKKVNRPRDFGRSALPDTSSRPRA